MLSQVGLSPPSKSQVFPRKVGNQRSLHSLSRCSAPSQSGRGPQCCGHPTGPSWVPSLGSRWGQLRAGQEGLCGRGGLVLLLLHLSLQFLSVVPGTAVQTWVLQSRSTTSSRLENLASSSLAAVGSSAEKGPLTSAAILWRETGRS